MSGAGPTRAAELGVPDPRARTDAEEPTTGTPTDAITGSVTHGDTPEPPVTGPLAGDGRSEGGLEVLDLLLGRPVPEEVGGAPDPASARPPEVPGSSADPADESPADRAAETATDSTERDTATDSTERDSTECATDAVPAVDLLGPETGPLEPVPAPVSQPAQGSAPDDEATGPVATGAVPVDLEHPARPGTERSWSSRDELRASAIWLWLWGPLLAAVVVVAFLAGLASAPVALPSSAQARPALLTDVTGRPIGTLDPPTPAEQLPAEQLPDLVLQAVVAVQDPGYFTRRGLAAGNLLAAGAADLVRVRRHGSTIEERYVRQVRIAAGSHVPSLRESGVAVRLSQQISRRALLTRYVNGMYFGNGVYGVAAAARYYFGVPLVRLGLPEIAMLAGIADDPTADNPIGAPARARSAQLAALDTMRRHGVVTAAQAEVAGQARLDIRAHPSAAAPSAAPDFASLIESSLLARFGEDAVYSQDLQVATSLDLDLQAALDGTIRRLVPRGSPAVLALATDPRTGNVRAMVVHGTPGGAAEVLFSRRPLGSLATALTPGPPPPGGQPPMLAAGDGQSASVGEVSSAIGAVAADGVRHDLREVMRVTRPAQAGQSAQVLDSADPLPAGQQVLSSDDATRLTGTFRTTARAAGPPGTRLPFALAAVQGVSANDTWYAGCVPTLCLTVWTGSPGPTAASIGSTERPVSPLARQIVTGTFTSYLAAAPDRLVVPPLPAPRPTVAPERPVPSAEVPQVAPSRSAVPEHVPAPAASPSTARATPTPTAPPAPTPQATPSATAGPGANPPDGKPVADGPVPDGG